MPPHRSDAASASGGSLYGELPGVSRSGSRRQRVTALLGGAHTQALLCGADPGQRILVWPSVQIKEGQHALCADGLVVHPLKVGLHARQQWENGH